MSSRRQIPPVETTARGPGAVASASGEYPITAPRSFGRELDDLELDLDDDADADALELECMPSSHRTQDTAFSPMLPPALDAGAPTHLRGIDGPPPRRATPSSQHAIDPHAALVAFAGFGAPPATLWGTPAYAVRVVERRRVLRAALGRARSLRSHDVGLYEAALEAADDDAVRKGIVLGLGTVAIVVFICVQMITGAVDLPW